MCIFLSSILFCYAVSVTRVAHSNATGITFNFSISICSGTGFTSPSEFSTSGLVTLSLTGSEGKRVGRDAVGDRDICGKLRRAAAKQVL